MGPPPPPAPLVTMVVVVVAPLITSTFSASEFSESGVADLVPSLSSPPQSLANRAAATASQEEAGAGRVFIACFLRVGAKKQKKLISSFPSTAIFMKSDVFLKKNSRGR